MQKDNRCVGFLEDLKVVCVTNQGVGWGGVDHVGVGGVGHVGWGGSCRGGVGSWLDGVGHVGVGWDVLCRGGVGHGGVRWVM